MIKYSQIIAIWVSSFVVYIVVYVLNKLIGTTTEAFDFFTAYTTSFHKKTYEGVMFMSSLTGNTSENVKLIY